MGYLAFAEYALNEAWRNPWTWPVRPPADRGAWICAALVFAAGLAAITLRGARTSLTDNLRDARRRFVSKGRARTTAQADRADS